MMVEPRATQRYHKMMMYGEDMMINVVEGDKTSLS